MVDKSAQASWHHEYDKGQRLPPTCYPLVVYVLQWGGIFLQSAFNCQTNLFTVHGAQDAYTLCAICTGELTAS